MQQEQEISLKKDLYVQLAFTLFGHIIGFDDKKNIVCKSVGFVASPEGEFFLLSKKTDSLDSMNFNEDILMTILKEGKSVSDMWDIHLKGILSIVEDAENIKKAKHLFEEKSPYLGSVGFLDLGKDYLLLSLKPKEIFFQNLKQEREGKDAYLLTPKQA